uniref:Transmembrane protein n=1 Tax=Steinernema glaseri TaxID=37863 RepID=A0A1I8ALB0_9BILA
MKTVTGRFPCRLRDLDYLCLIYRARIIYRHAYAFKSMLGFWLAYIEYLIVLVLVSNKGITEHLSLLVTDGTVVAELPATVQYHTRRSYSGFFSNSNNLETCAVSKVQRAPNVGDPWKD